MSKLHDTHTRAHGISKSRTTVLQLRHSCRPTVDAGEEEAEEEEEVCTQRLHVVDAIMTLARKLISKYNIKCQ